MDITDTLCGYYAAPELLGESISMIANFKQDLEFSGRRICPHCNTRARPLGYVGSYRRSKIGLVVCQNCKRVIGAY